MRGKFVAALGAAALLISAAAPVSADSITIKFTRVINPLELSDEDQVAGQLFVIVSDTQANGDPFDTPSRVRFTFGNTSEVQSSVSEIYFDDGTLLGISELINDPSFTDFIPGDASPGNLPGGQNLDPPFETTAGFLADAVGNPDVGINQAHERVHIYFDLTNGQGYDSIVNALNLGGAAGGLRIGLHVRSIGDNETSASYVNTPPVVPTPAAAVGGLALLGVMLCTRRRVAI